MKWFKHLSGSLNDSFIFDLIEQFGGDGYLVFFGTLELMADEFDVESPGKVQLSVKKLTKNLQLSRQKTLKILKYCDEKKRIFCNVNKKYIDLYCPRLQELTDEYTQKLLKQKSGQTPDSHRDKLRPKEEEVRKRKKNSKKKAPQFKQKDFDIFYQNYPKHQGEDKALENWKKRLKANSLPPLEELLDAIEKQKAEKENKRAMGKFVPEWPMPQVWIKDGRWKDEVEPIDRWT